MPGLGGNTWAPRPKSTGFARPSTRPGGTIGPASRNYNRPGAGGAKTGSITDRVMKPKKMVAGVPRKRIPTGPPRAYVGANEKRQDTTRETRGKRQQFTPWMPPGQQAGVQQMQFSTQPVQQQQPDLLAQRLHSLMGSSQWGQAQQPVQPQPSVFGQVAQAAAPVQMGQPQAVQPQVQQPQVMPWRSPLVAQTPGIGQPQQPFNPYQQGGQMPYRPMYNTGFGGGYGRY